jgi:hypothetical protein
LKTTTGGIVSNKANQLSQPGFDIFPNPAHGKVTIVNQQAKASVENVLCIFSINGQMLITDKKPFLQQREIDIQSLKPGVYVLQVQTQTGVSSRKLIVN